MILFPDFQSDREGTIEGGKKIAGWYIIDTAVGIFASDCDYIGISDGRNLYSAGQDGDSQYRSVYYFIYNRNLWVYDAADHKAAKIFQAVCQDES